MNNIKYVYLRFTSCKTFMSWLVSTWTGGWPSHVEFVITPGQYLGSDIDVGVKLVNDEYYEDAKLKHIEFYKIQVTNDEYENIYKLAESQLGKKYDTWALVGNVLRRNWQETDKWFCSELVAWAFDKSDKPLINNRTNRVVPIDLIRSTHLIRCNESDIQ